MDSPPAGYVTPFWVYLVEIPSGEASPSHVQAGGFTVEAEAALVRDQLIAEGVEGANVNMVPIHVTHADWEYDR